MNVTTHVRMIVVVLGGFCFLAGCSVSFTASKPSGRVSESKVTVPEKDAAADSAVESPVEKEPPSEAEPSASPAPASEANLPATISPLASKTLPVSADQSTPSADATRGTGSPGTPTTFVPKTISDDPNQPVDLTFDDIKFDMEKGATFHRKFLRPDIERYQDRKITIRGYILPGFQERGISQFVLVRDNMECCFGPGAALYDCILVTMAGPTVNYTVRPVTVEGTFTIDPFEGPGGAIFAIYRLQGDRTE